MLTKRERDLNKAREAGEAAYYSRDSMPDFNGDKGMQEAWKQGLRLKIDSERAWDDYWNNLWKNYK